MRSRYECVYNKKYNINLLGKENRMGESIKKFFWLIELQSFMVTNPIKKHIIQKNADYIREELYKINIENGSVTLNKIYNIIFERINMLQCRRKYFGINNSNWDVQWLLMQIKLMQFL